jgi:hypothetical protein
MSGGVLVGPFVEFEAVGVAVGAALVSAVLSLLGPYLASLTGTLAALAFAGWAAARTRSGRSSGSVQGWATVLVLVGLGVGALLFLIPPASIVQFRALPLAAALVPLWWITPRRLL